MQGFIGVKNMAKNFLIIETSDHDSFVALHLTDGELKVVFLPFPSTPSQTLLSAVKTLLTHQTIDFIAIGTGPGLFTGTRVGVMTAKSLAFARALPLVPFCSLKRFIPTVDGSFTIVTKSKTRGCYVLKGVKRGMECLFENLCLQKNFVKVEKSILNLSMLKHLLLKSFLMGEGMSHDEVQIHYLHPL